MRQLLKNNGIQERYGDKDEHKRIFKQQIEQAQGLSP